MKKLQIFFGLCILLLTMVAAVQVPRSIALPPEEGGAWIVGAGTIGAGDTLDSFGGSAMTMKDKAIRGQWTHIDHVNLLGTPTQNGKNIFRGDVHYIVAKKFPLNGPEVPKAYPNYANFGGTGTFNDVSGYFFDVKVFDHSEKGAFHDRYVIDIYDANHNLVLHADGTTSGTCLEPSAPPDLAWVNDMGCLSSGNIQILPPVGGHPY